MKNEINSIDMNGKLDHEELYNLFKTHSLKINKKIFKKINNFKYNMDFFKFYSNEDIKNLLNIFELKLSENNDEFFSSFKSDIEQYIACISQIILSIKLFLKTHDILMKIVINAKNYLSKLKYQNKLENCNQDYLFLYLESLLKISEKNHKFNNSNISTLISNNISSYLDIPKNNLFSKYFNVFKINNLLNSEIESSIYDDPPTPRFELESDEDFENQEKTNLSLDNSTENTSPIKKDSALTLSEYVFVKEPFTPQNHELKLIESPIVNIKKNNSSTLETQIENVNKHKNKRNISYRNKINLIKKNKNKNHYKNLLEMIIKIYKMELINSEEKIKLKQLVIKKSKKIEYFYYYIYLNSKNDKKTLITEVKKIMY